jgi:hypothetical protein
MSTNDEQPLLTAREKLMSVSDGGRRTMTLRVYDDRVECTKPGLLTRGATDTIRYEQIAQVVVDRRIMWSKLAVETNGGGGFQIAGLNKDEADTAKTLIDERVARLQTATAATHATDTAPPIATQLAQLGALRESGVLTDDEFAVAKTRLLNG